MWKCWQMKLDVHHVFLAGTFGVTGNRFLATPAAWCWRCGSVFHASPPYGKISANCLFNIWHNCSWPSEDWSFCDHVTFFLSSPSEFEFLIWVQSLLADVSMLSLVNTTVIRLDMYEECFYCTSSQNILHVDISMFKRNSRKLPFISQMFRQPSCSSVTLLESLLATVSV